MEMSLCICVFGSVSLYCALSCLYVCALSCLYVWVVAYHEEGCISLDLNWIQGKPKGIWFQRCREDGCCCWRTQSHYRYTYTFLTNSYRFYHSFSPWIPIMNRALLVWAGSRRNHKIRGPTIYGVNLKR